MKALALYVRLAGERFGKLAGFDLVSDPAKICHLGRRRTHRWRPERRLLAAATRLAARNTAGQTVRDRIQALLIRPAAPTAFLAASRSGRLSYCRTCTRPAALARCTCLAIRPKTRHRAGDARLAAAARISSPALSFALALRLPGRLCLALSTALAFAANGVTEVVRIRVRTAPLPADPSTRLATPCPAAIITRTICFFFFADVTAVDVATGCDTDHHALNHDEVPPR
jgi:hypothetical protein